MYIIYLVKEIFFMLNLVFFILKYTVNVRLCGKGLNVFRQIEKKFFLNFLKKFLN